MKNSLAYQIKQSKRAKHVRLKISARDGLVIVVPFGFNQRKIPAIVQRKMKWIDKTLRKVQERRQQLQTRQSQPLPDLIPLRAIDQVWSVKYEATPDPWVAVKEGEQQQLLVYGDIGSADACQAALRQWLRQQAELRLIPWLKAASGEMKLPFKRVIVRNQKTRWGSYSSKGTISLNQKLLFLPKDLAHYVLIHELCHAKHLNHSPEYWALIKKHEPSFQELDKQLRTSWKQVPCWSHSG